MTKIDEVIHQFRNRIWEALDRHPGAREAYERGKRIGAVLMEQAAKRRAGLQAFKAADQHLKQQGQAARRPALPLRQDSNDKAKGLAALQREPIQYVSTPRRAQFQIDRKS